LDKLIPHWPVLAIAEDLSFLPGDRLLYRHHIEHEVESLFRVASETFPKDAKDGRPLPG